jgi:hypothetical protein
VGLEIRNLYINIDILCLIPEFHYRNFSILNKYLISLFLIHNIDILPFIYGFFHRNFLIQNFHFFLRFNSHIVNFGHEFLSFCPKILCHMDSVIKWFIYHWITNFAVLFFVNQRLLRPNLQMGKFIRDYAERTHILLLYIFALGEFSFKCVLYF